MLSNDCVCTPGPVCCIVVLNVCTWLQELEGIVSRAALQSPDSAEQLPEEVFWFATQSKDRLKWNLLSPGAFPWLKPFFKRYLYTVTAVS